MFEFKSNNYTVFYLSQMCCVPCPPLYLPPLELIDSLFMVPFISVVGLLVISLHRAVLVVALEFIAYIFNLPHSIFRRYYVPAV